MAKEIECTLCGHTAGRHREQRIGTDILGKSCCDCHCTEWRETVERECVEPQADTDCLGCDGTGLKFYTYTDGRAPDVDKCPVHFISNEHSTMMINKLNANKPDTSLSLLVCDFGNFTLVKAEKGDGSFKIGSVTYSCPEGEFQTVQSYDFAAVREAIDGEKPEYKELETILEEGLESLRTLKRDSSATYTAQIQIATETIQRFATKAYGVPIYESGTWEQLGVFPELIRCDGFNDDQPLAPVADVIGQMKPLPFKAYRYTR